MSQMRIRFGCVTALRAAPVRVPAARDVRDTVTRGPVQRGTPSDGTLAQGHSRSGFAASEKPAAMTGRLRNR